MIGDLLSNNARKRLPLLSLNTENGFYVSLSIFTCIIFTFSSLFHYPKHVLLSFKLHSFPLVYRSFLFDNLKQNNQKYFFSAFLSL